MDTPGKRILRWREHLGITTKELEAQTGIPYSTLKTLETDPNKGKPSFDVLAKLRKAYSELNIDWLFDEGDTEPMLREDRKLIRVASAPVVAEPEPSQPTPLPSGASPMIIVDESAELREVKGERDNLRRQVDMLLNILRGPLRPQELSTVAVSEGGKLQGSKPAADEPVSHMQVEVHGLRRYTTSTTRLAWVDEALAGPFTSPGHQMWLAQG